MQSRKTETLTIRLYPETKAALRLAAEREQRSLSNMLDVMIKRYQDQATPLHFDKNSHQLDENR